MQSKATSSNPTAIHRRQSHGAIFTKVINGRKQPIRGLWKRNDRYYAQLTFEHHETGEKKNRRVPLVDKDGNAVAGVVEAQQALERLRVQRADNTLPTLRRTPTIGDYITSYLDAIGCGQGIKKPGTVQKERASLTEWAKHFGARVIESVDANGRTVRTFEGGRRLDEIKRAGINKFKDKRIKDGLAPRTFNLDVVALRNVLKRAQDDQIIQRLPTEGMRPLKVRTRKRPLFTSADLDKLCAAAFGTKRTEQSAKAPLTKNAQQFVDYVRLLAYSGARRNEALALRWADVDFEQEQLTIGADGDTKNSTARGVDFNPKLKTHLRDMAERAAPDSQWLFPSPQRGQRDVPLKTFRESLDLVRDRAGMSHFTFHDCRHHFISMCVMSGVDYMTIAAWVGHRDGGVLIGKVYGHLANEHRKRMAGQVAFEPVAVVMESATA